MDEAGIDMQVLSHSIAGLQRLDAGTAVPLARRANDRLNEVMRDHPDRFAAFAGLPTADPKGATDEFERTVAERGFKGAMVNGLTNGIVGDDKRFWPMSGVFDTYPRRKIIIGHLGVGLPFYPGASATGCSAVTAPNRSATSSASTFTSRPVGSPIPRSCAG
jgi:predicted TIM-barrel fold metal-dependent hydrolase